MHVNSVSSSEHLRLLLRVPVDRDETLGSFVLKSARANHSVSAANILRLCCRNITYPLLSEVPLIAHMCRVECESLAALSGVWRVSQNARQYRYRRAWLPGKPYLLGSCTRACPACLREMAISRPEWEVAIWPLCVLHGRLLIDRCSRCGRRLNIHRLGVSECSCGYDLCRISPPQANPAEVEIVNLAQKVGEEASRLEHVLRWHWFLGVTFPALLMRRHELGGEGARRRRSSASREPCARLCRQLACEISIRCGGAIPNAGYRKRAGCEAGLS